MMELNLLEDWLYKAVNPPSSTSVKPAPPLTPQQVARAWAQLKTCIQRGHLEPEHVTALAFLRDCGRHLLLGEKEANVLIAILSSLAEADKELLGQARCSAAVLLSIWLRKSFKAADGSRSNHNLSIRSRQALELAISSTLKLLENPDDTCCFVNEAILLLGTICITPYVQEGARKACLEAILTKCLAERKTIMKGSLIEALAGLGYAMVSSQTHHVVAVLRAVLSLWWEDLDSISKAAPNLKDGLLLLHLMEWCGSTFITQAAFGGAARAKLIVHEIAEGNNDHSNPTTKCVIMLTAAGLLRSFSQHLSGGQNKYQDCQSMAISLESTMASMMESCFHEQVKMVSKLMETTTIELAFQHEDQSCLLPTFTREKHWEQCIALSISRYNRFPYRPSALLCLTVVLVEDALPLSSFYNNHGINFWKLLQNTLQTTWHYEHKNLLTHVDGILFQEAAGISRAICNQYRLADRAWQLWVENLLWQFSHAAYKSQRCFSMNVHFGDANVEKGALTHILQMVLLSSVMIFSSAMRSKIHATRDDKGLFAAQVLSALSYLEFVRQGYVPEYSELVQRSVEWVSQSELACPNLVSLSPTLDEVLKPPGSDIRNYDWTQDTVQSARVLFSFCVLPFCLSLLPLSSFASRVAPVMLLYLQHPVQTLVQASHALFTAFISFQGDSKEANDSMEHDRDSVKEQLAASYVEKTLENFSRSLSFDLLVSGVGAIVRHLPAGSPVTVCCISCLAKKGAEFFQCLSIKEQSKETHQPQKEELETAKKIQTLLLHLILLVDIQVLPHILKEVARLILGLPSPYQTDALEEAFDVLAGSDDLTRKHIIVPWLQSLSYLCSHPNNEERQQAAKKDAHNVATEHQQDGAINLNITSSFRSGDCRVLIDGDNEATALPLQSRL